MLSRSRIVAVVVAAIALATLIAGCDDNGSGGPTATQPQATATTAATATPPPDIRAEPLAGQPEVVEFVSTAGGVADVDRAIYADLTGDGAEEAVLPVSSGGEGGDIAIFVYGYGDDGVEELLQVLPEETNSIMASVEHGQLVTVEGVYAPGDPLSFPSQLLRRYYAWDGDELAVDREEQLPAR